MVWPVTWPESANAASLDPNLKKLCELYATMCMKALTLHRVGGNPVTIMPGSRERMPGHYLWDPRIDGEYRTGSFYPGLVYPSSTDLQGRAPYAVEAVDLPGPVSTITEVRIDGAILDAGKYRVEHGRYLVRLDGGTWPFNTGGDFTVTYLNSHPVDDMGAHAAGVMANEWLTLFTTNKKCRLPANVTSVSRQGLTVERAAGMFPEGVTGIPEIDAYLLLWNPFGFKVAPRVYSPDLPQHRQVWSA